MTMRDEQKTSSKDIIFAFRIPLLICSSHSNAFKFRVVWEFLAKIPPRLRTYEFMSLVLWLSIFITLFLSVTLSPRQSYKLHSWCAYRSKFICGAIVCWNFKLDIPRKEGERELFLWQCFRNWYNFTITTVHHMPFVISDFVCCGKSLWKFQCTGFF